MRIRLNLFNIRVPKVFYLVFAILIILFVIWRMLTASSEIDKMLEGFSVETVTDSEVADKVLYSAHSSWHSYSGKGSGVDSNRYDDVDRDICEYSIGELKGFLVASASNAENAKLTLKIMSKMEAGAGKIAIIKDGAVLEYVEFGVDVTREYDVSGKSLFLVKAICDEAKIELTVERTITKNNQP